MFGTIVVLTGVLYYIHLGFMAQYRFNQSNRNLTLVAMACLPFYVFKTAVKTQDFQGLTMVERLNNVIKIVFRHDIYVAVLQEIIEFYTSEEDMVTLRHVFNSEVVYLYEKFLREGVHTGTVK